MLGGVLLQVYQQVGPSMGQQVGPLCTTHLCETSEEKKKDNRSYDQQSILPGQAVVAPQVRPVVPAPDGGATPAPIAKRSPAGPARVLLADVVNGLRSCYPHPTNKGSPRRIPNPLAIEGWLGERIRLGQLEPGAYGQVLTAAKREAELAEKNPEAFRLKLRTWIRETKWTDTIEEEDPCPALPPKSEGPRFTPAGWFKQQLPPE